jgi:dihydropyrimidinase
MPSTLIKNGTVVTAECTFAADILIDGEKIRDIAPSLPAEQAGRVIDAADACCPAHRRPYASDMPLRWNYFLRHFETGTRAA